MSARFISVFALVAGFVLLLGAQSVLATGGSYGGKSSYGSYTGHEIYGGKYKSHKYSVKSSQCSHGSNSCGTASCGGGGQDDSGSDPAPAGCTTLDFEFDANGNSLSKGQVIDDEFAAWGITVSATGGANKAMVFDTAHPTGGDTDLRTPGSGAGNDSALGKVLIISEDGHSNDPDDNWGGGTITFDYDTPVSIDGVRILDIDSGETGGTVEAFDAAGNLIAWEWIDDKGNNSVQLVDLTASGVSRLEVNLISSGAVAEIVYCNDDSAPPPPPASCDSQTATVDGSFSEWDLGADEAAPMFKDGNPAETQFATLYLRQDYDNARVYALVLAEDGFSVKNYNPWNFIKVGDHYVVKADGSVSGSEFDWVYSGSTRIGYEASFSHDDAVIYDLFAQVKIISGGNHYKAQTGSIDLDATCDDNSEPPTADFVQDEDGLVCFQAENYSNKTSGNGQSWEIDDSSIADGANGDAMIVADAGQAFYNGGYAPTGTPRMDYSVDFRFGGTHYFWARVYGEGDSSANDSIHAGINANATPELSKIHVDPDNRWTWEKRAFDLGTAGIKDINVWMREDGTRVDEICISNDSSFNPGYDDTPTPPTGDSNATCAAANVDGNASEWTDEDYFGRMYQGGDEGSQYLSDLYVRYDNGVVYLMALAAEGLEARTYAPWNWVKLGANTVVNANSGDNGNAPDFKWINASNGAADGWEASFPADEGTYHDFVAQLKVDDAEGVHQKSRNASTTLVIDCSNPQPQLGSIGDTVYEDFNGNGAQDALEPGIEGVTVTLRDSAGNVIATDETDANGNYLFENRASDDYKVVVDGASAPINGWTNTGDPDGTTDGQSVLTLGEGENNLAQDFGYKPPFIGNVGDCDTECKGGVIELSLLNNGPDGDIVVTDKHDRVLFAGHVPTGTEFTFLGKEDHGKMGTWIYVDNGAGQTDIHTSCSQEIGAGAVFGDFEVVYSISKDNGLVCPVTDPGPGGDCQECDGKVTHLTLRNDGPGAYITVQDKKNEVTLFEGQVANGGTFSVDGFDDKGTLGTEIKVYADGAETSIHTSCSVDIGPNAVFGNFVVVEGASRNGGELCPLPDPGPGPGPGPGDCQECDGKVTNLTLKNLGASAYIVVKNKKKTRILFEGQVASGGTFSLVGFDKKGTLGTEIKIYANGNETKIHTSCSVEIGPGSVFGDFLVVDGASRNGGQLCPIDGYNVCTAGDERVIDFELDSAGNAISLGDIITNQYAAQGVTVSAHGNPYDIAMVFDTANPTGGDNDLRTPGSGAGNDTALGNVLIISENGDSSNPDDEAEGGALIFDYANPIRVDALKVLDIEHGGSDIEAFDANGNSLGVIDIPGVGDNSVQTVQIGIDGVSRLVVNLTTSGAVGDLVYCGDAGNQPLVGSIGDRVWLDADADGNQDAGESGIAGVTVELLDGNGSVIDTDTTDANGEYLFTGLVADNYTLRVSGSPLSGLEQTFDDDGIASADQSTYALGAGENERDQDFGYTEPVLGCATPQAIDFETDAAGNPLGAGARITTQYASAGVIVGAVNPHKTHNVAMVFDSSNPTGGDNDLRTPGSGIGNNSALGNILIISEDNDASDPDDEARGGQIYFDYASPVRVDELVIVDIDSTSNGGFVEVFDANGASLGTVAIVPLGDNSVQTVTVGIENVSRLEVNFVSSAAVGEVVYCGEPGTANVGSIGDRVWLDLDRDGVQDGGAEVGINGVTVELLNAGGSVIATDTTSGDGQYLFEGLAAGTYTVRVSGAPLNGLLHTFDYDGGTAAPNQQSTYNLAQGEHERRQDFGFALGSIGDRVWLDLNADGVQDGNENGIEGVTVTLLDDQGSAPRTTTTDANGEYLFEGLRAANYTVLVGGTALNGLAQTYDDDDGLGASDKMSVYALGAGEHERDQDFGFTLGSIGDRVWLDLNADGVQDGNESGIEGVTVTLLDDQGSFPRTTTTDANGEYLFDGLVAGNYTVLVGGAPLNGLAQTYDYDDGLGASDKQSVYALSAGEHQRDQDFGFTLGSIGDTIFFDDNGNGVQDGAELGVEGVEVTVTGPNGFSETVTTDDSGFYEVTGLLAGDYTVTVSAGAGTPLEGYVNTADPDGTPDSTTVEDIAAGENDDVQDFGYRKSTNTLTASIGDRVWLDENSDGVQDAGEAGIANVLVQLFDENSVDPIAEDITDSDGGYLFTGLEPGVYFVSISDLPANLFGTFDEDDGVVGNPDDFVTPEEIEVDLEAGEHHRTADFGYNHATGDETKLPFDTDVGAIGDRVWYDTDGDGLQDAGEAGIPGVTLNLLVDNDADGVYETVLATQVTDEAGGYLFENLNPGAYVVEVVVSTVPAGYVQSGDPEGQSSLDNRTTNAVVIGPGDVWVNADFGYVPDTADTVAIGDTVYFDVDGDGVEDAEDYGIAGVTLKLLDSNDIVIATQVTDQNGNYLFDGLPAGEYTVVVNDTRNVLGNLVQSGDPEGNNDGRSTTTVPSGEDRLRDFGYTPAGHGPNDGLIGDTVFLDRDSNGEPGSDEGIAGVTVRLLNEDGALLAETQTDENGRYYFGGLDRNATYQVVVDETTLPEGVSQTVDPDATLDSRSTVDLSQDADGIDLDQDFGYEGLNRLEGTIWLDSDADGLLDGDENSRFNQITVVLRDENGNLVGVTRSDLEGNFSFDKLPDGTFSVDVTDDRNLLEGYWHSVVPASTADNESKQEPYAVTLGAGNRVDTTSDFGYFKRPAAIGNRVWFDLMDNGLQNDGEPGLAGALIELTVTYPSGAVVTAVVESQADGFYQFGGLLLDEDFDGVGAPGFDEPRFDLQVVADPVGYVPTLTIDVPGNDLLDSDDHAGVQAFTKQGADQVPLVVDAWETEADPNASYDFGYVVEIVQDPIARIEGRVYLDVNEDGDYDEGIDQPYEGVFIDITDLDTMELIPDEVVTGPDGTFGVDVAPGPYEIHVDDSDLPPDMTIDDFGDGMNPDNVTAVVDEVVRDNFGYIEPVLTCNEICDIDMTGGVSLDDYLDIDGVLQDTLVPIGAANSGDCVQDGRITGDDALACYFWINEPRRNP